MSGSSDSSSGGAGVEAGLGVAEGADLVGSFACAVGRADSVDAETGFAAFVASFCGLGSGAGVSSTAECWPLVHGGMVMNSSNVRTLGLQHFHPFCPSWNSGG